MRLSAAEFVSAWQSSDCMTEFLRKTGYGRRTAIQRAFKLRQRGVQLKLMKIGTNGYTKDKVNDLNKMIQEITDEKEKLEDQRQRGIKPPPPKPEGGNTKVERTKRSKKP